MAEREFGAVVEAAEPIQKVPGLAWLARAELSRVRGLSIATSGEDRSRVEAARRHLQEAARIAPDDAELLILQAQVSELLGDDKASAELERKASNSPQLAALAIRNHIGASPVNKESAALVRNLAQRHAASALVQGAAADFFEYACTDRRASVAKVEGPERDTALAAARSYRDAATQYARSAFELQEENEANAHRLFDFLRDDKQTAEASALADRLAAKPVSEALGLALRGRLLEDEGKTEEAVRQFQKSVTLQPDDWRVYYWLGQAYAKVRGKSDEAEAAFGRALELSPTATSVRDVFFHLLDDEGKLTRLQLEIEKAQRDSPRDLSLLTLSARLFDKAGEPERAEAQWRQIAEMVPDSAQYQAEYSLALVRNGKAAEGGAVARRALAINERFLPALRALLLAQSASGDRAGAEETLQRVVAERPDETALQALAMDFYRSLGELPQAEIELKKLAQSRSSDPASHYLLAEYYACQGRQEEALKEYDECLKLDATFASAGVGAFHALLGQAERAADPQQKQACIAEAQAKLADLQKSSPKSLTAAVAEIELFVFQRDYARAEQKLNDALREFPEQPRLKVLRGRFLFEQGRSDEATTYLRSVVEQEPRLAEAHFLLAQAAFEENHLRDAAESCRLGLQYDPASADGHSLLAQIAGRTGEGAQELEELRRVWALRPYDRVALFRLVQALTAARHDQEALQTAEVAFKNNPASAAFLEEYARCVMAAGKPAQAEAACRAFRSAHADDEAAALFLAQVLFLQGKTDEGCQVLTAAARSAENPTSCLYRAVQVCLAASANGPAVAFARRLVDAAPDNPDAAKALVQALNAAGQTQEALQTAVEAAHKHPDTAAFAQLAAGTLKDAKQPDRAMEECIRFLSRHPEDAGAQLTLAQLQIGAGRPEDAAATLKKVEAPGVKAAPQALEAVVRGYLQLKRYAEAEAVGRRLCEAAPDSAAAWLACATVYELQGDAAQEKAIALYREALSRPLRPLAVRAILQNNLAYRLASKALANPSEADRLLAEAETRADLATGDRNTAQTLLLDTLGWIKLLRDKPADAADLLETAAERRDATGEVLYHYAAACVRTGKLPLALEMASKAVERNPNHPEWLAQIKARVAQSEKNSEARKDE
jgi:tetratricopeptide (TPR) repeat protein